jgi:hypothetical protein
MGANQSGVDDCGTDDLMGSAVLRTECFWQELFRRQKGPCLDTTGYTHEHDAAACCGPEASAAPALAFRAGRAMPK